MPHLNVTHAYKMDDRPAQRGRRQITEDPRNLRKTRNQLVQDGYVTGDPWP
jgi:hypothetical protein